MTEEEKKAKKREYNQVYRAAHREECRARSRAFNAAHREKYRAASRAHYATHRDEVRERDRTIRRIRGWARWFDGCARCGCQIDPVALELHHRNPGEKEVEPGNATSWKRWFAEYLKCEVLCSNCHRIVHKELKAA
ncbi:MAG: HNH endonuclease signature motif containing protein [bacterium]